MNTQFRLHTKSDLTKLWDEQKLEHKLEHLANAGKSTTWIRRNLTIVKSSFIGRLLWCIAKHFDWMRRLFYDIDLERSKALLKELQPQVYSKGNARLQKLFEKAVGNFNHIAPRHAVRLPQRQPENCVAESSLDEQEANKQISEFQSYDEILKFAGKHGEKVSSLDLKFKKNLTDDHLEQVIKRCPNLKELFIGSMKITDSAMDSIRKACPSLETLELNRCYKLSNYAFEDIAQFKSLNTFGSVTLAIFQNKALPILQKQPRCKTS